MLFKRRRKRNIIGWIKDFLYFRVSYRRSIRYILHRMRRLSGTPHTIAFGFAIGVSVSFTPFVGLHFLISIILAWLTGANMLASAIGTFIGNPITFPFIWIGTFTLGNTMSGSDPHGLLTLNMSDGLWTFIRSHSFEIVLPIMKTMFIGSIPLGMAAGLIFYWPVRILVYNYQEHRRRKLFKSRDIIKNDEGKEHSP